jgi:DNA-binding CsgD family transcriptional regulator
VARASHNGGPIGAEPLIDALSADVLQTLYAVQFPVGLIDLERRVRWQNPASIALVGDVRGKLDSSVVAPEDLEEARVQFARKVMGALHTEHVVTVICADGTRARLETSSVPIRAGSTVIGVLAMAHVDQRERPSESAPRLTPRERQTLLLLAAGSSTRQMAELMGIAPETVRNHVKSMCGRLGARSRIEAIAKARRAGLL